MDHGLFQNTILTFSSMNWRKPWTTMTNLCQDGKSPSSIQNRHHHNWCHIHYHSLPATCTNTLQKLYYIRNKTTLFWVMMSHRLINISCHKVWLIGTSISAEPAAPIYRVDVFCNQGSRFHWNSDVNLPNYMALHKKIA